MPGGKRVYESADAQGVEAGSGGIEHGVIEAVGRNGERAGST